MKSTGIIRTIDNLGRIVLPKELRTALKLDADARLEIFVDGDTVLLRKYRAAGSCDFCGEISPDSVRFGDTCICRSCQEKISHL